VRWLLLFAAGGTGALLRYGVAGLVQTRAGASFPWGTLAVNVSGCLLIGLLATWFESRSLLSAELRIAVLVGLLGGFTTFSTFGFETWRLLEGGELIGATANVLGSVLAGIAAVAVGIQIGRLLA